MTFAVILPFDEAAKLFYQLGEGGSPDHGSLLVAVYECLWSQESCVKTGGSPGQQFSHWPCRWSS